MSAAETLSSAQDAGVCLGLDGVDLLIEADCEPPSELLDALRRDKPGVLALIRTHETGEVPLLSATIESPTIQRRPRRRGGARPTRSAQRRSGGGVRRPVRPADRQGQRH